MGAVVHPFARCRDPLASRDGGRIADARAQITVPTCLSPENAEPVLLITEGDALYKARQHFLGQWLRLRLHLCWRFWRAPHGTSNQPERFPSCDTDFTAPVCSRPTRRSEWMGCRHPFRPFAGAGKCGFRACEWLHWNCSPTILSITSRAKSGAGGRDTDI